MKQFRKFLYISLFYSIFFLFVFNTTIVKGEDNLFRIPHIVREMANSPNTKIFFSNFVSKLINYIPIGTMIFVGTFHITLLFITEYYTKNIIPLLSTPLTLVDFWLGKVIYVSLAIYVMSLSSLFGLLLYLILLGVSVRITLQNVFHIIVVAPIINFGILSFIGCLSLLFVDKLIPTRILITYAYSILFIAFFYFMEPDKLERIHFLLKPNLIFILAGLVLFIISYYLVKNTSIEKILQKGSS